VQYEYTVGGVTRERIYLRERLPVGDGLLAVVGKLRPVLQAGIPGLGSASFEAKAFDSCAALECLVLSGRDDISCRREIGHEGPAKSATAEYKWKMCITGFRWGQNSWGYAFSRAMLIN
jgi:hypothetical protein